MLITIIKRELLLVYRKPSIALNPLAFFMMVMTLYPMAISPSPTTLQMLGPGAIWVTALLASLLALDHLFIHDYEDGSLEQLMILSNSPLQLVYAKICAHWLATIAPLILMLPLLGLVMNLPIETTGWLTLSLILGTPIVTFVGAIAAALTVGLKKGSALTALLILPLYVPTLILGVGLTNNASMGFDVSGVAAALGAMSLAAITFAPHAIYASLKVAIR